tara:strand:- start:8817 stop:9395 length:579 start_codon:yes stop_codon:yes gene_type:complete
MDTENIKKLLEEFGQKVVDDAKFNLLYEKGSTVLGDSIRFEVVPDSQGFTTRFYMESYGEYLDKGVSGNENEVSFEDYKGTIRSSPYQYTTKGPPIDILSKWIKRKGIEPKGLGRGRSKSYTSKSGKKVKGTGQYLSGFAYLISKKIKREGIKSLSFFQKPVGKEYTALKEDFLEELKLDIETYITTFYRPK